MPNQGDDSIPVPVWSDAETLMPRTVSRRDFPKIPISSTRAPTSFQDGFYSWIQTMQTSILCVTPDDGGATARRSIFCTVEENGSEAILVREASEERFHAGRQPRRSIGELSFPENSPRRTRHDKGFDVPGGLDQEVACLSPAGMYAENEGGYYLAEDSDGMTDSGKNFVCAVHPPRLGGA
jgi:hypothetical protein